MAPCLFFFPPPEVCLQAGLHQDRRRNICLLPSSHWIQYSVSCSLYTVSLSSQMFVVMAKDIPLILMEGITIYNWKPGHVESIQDCAETTAWPVVLRRNPIWRVKRSSTFSCCQPLQQIFPPSYGGRKWKLLHGSLGQCLNLTSWSQCREFT